MSSSGNLNEVSPIAEAPKPATARKIFFGTDGLRVPWRLAIFIVMLSLASFAILMLLRRIPVLRQIFHDAQSGTLTPVFELVFETAFIAALFFATAVMARIERRSFADYGLPLRGAFRKLFWQGAAWGLIMESLIILGIAVFHGFSLGTLALSGADLPKYVIAWACGFVLVGIFEEFLFRGYAQSTLSNGIGFWPAAFMWSALFGAVHLANPGEGWVGALSVMLFGLFACFTLKRTGSLWFAIGLHAAGDYAQTFLYSVPDSGMLAKGHLLNSSLHGPRWLAGGTIGPEGSVMDFIVLLTAFVFFAWCYPARNINV